MPVALLASSKKLIMADSKKADCKLIGMTDDELNLFVGEEKVPSGSNSVELRITHGLLSQIFSLLESFARPQQSQDKSNFSKIYEPLYKIDKGKSSDCIFLKSRGLDLKFLDSICKGNVALPDGFQNSPLTDQEILILLYAKMKLNASWIDIKDWVCFLCCDDNDVIFEESL